MSVFASPAGVTGSVFAGGGFSPRKLFSAGEQGVWYDPSDLTTLFTDTAGTQPVTAAGQEVARINDKSGRGNHATQGTLAARPFYAVVPRTGRRNLLTYSEQFDNAAWEKAFSTVAQVSGAEWTLAENATTSRKYIRAVGKTLLDGRFSIEAKPNGRNFIALGTTNGGGFWSVYLFNLATGAAVAGYEAGGLPIPTAPAIAAAGDGWYRVEVTLKTADVCVIMVGNGGDPIFEGYTGNGTSGIRIRKPQLELGSTATAYQRVVTQYDVSEASVEALHYLSFDGTDDGLATSAIDFTATDKMSVFAGNRRNSGITTGMLVETSATFFGTDGSLAIVANSGNYEFYGHGTDPAGWAAGVAAPTTDVLSMALDIAGATRVEEVRPRINGVVPALSGGAAGPLGTGNFGNHALYIGRRGGVSLPFNGWLYGLIVRGAASSTAQIANTERWLNRKTGAY